jgi:N-acetylglucosaminyldiphosphoundecaprenol N-acetyl-beta-D-mannosaminyltransferase
VEPPVGTPPRRVDVLGVEVDEVSVPELHLEIERLARGPRRALVLNANAHLLNLAYRDPALRRFLNTADVMVCDGAGVSLAARVLSGRSLPRITYADWMPVLGRFATERGLSMYFLGGRPGVAAGAARSLRQTAPGLRVLGTRHGFFDKAENNPENREVVAEINALGPDLLIVGFGMPLQERWLMQNRHRLDVGVAMTGGAVFDYASGRLRRGPKLLTNNGFEWLARLAVEPRRLWRRYLLGNPLFVGRVLRQYLLQRRWTKPG